MSSKATPWTKALSRAGQLVCVLLALLVATQIVAGVVWWLTGGPSLIPAGMVLTPQPLALRVLGVVLFLVSRVLIFVVLLQLFRLCGNFANGEAFADATVSRMYRVGVLVMATGGVLELPVLLPWALASLGLVDRQYAQFGFFLSMVTQFTGPLMVGGAVLLGARILDETRKLREQADQLVLDELRSLREQADQLRREAELVV
jgi:hypothetical protein